MAQKLNLHQNDLVMRSNTPKLQDFKAFKSFINEIYQSENWIEGINGIENSLKILNENSKEYWNIKYHLIRFRLFSETIDNMKAISELKNVERACLEHKLNKLIGRVYQEKSYCYKDEDKLWAALEEGKNAHDFLDLYGERSDYQMNLIHLTLVSEELGEQAEKNLHKDYLMPPFEKNVLYPLVIMEWKLGGDIYPTERTHSYFERIWTKRWLEDEFDSLEIYDVYWDTEQGLVRLDCGKEAPLRPQSLEGMLFNSLQTYPKTEKELATILWPKNPEAHDIPVKLQRLLARLNKKMNKIVIFDGTTYFLNKKVQKSCDI